jgi:hypothetical protein
VAGFDPPNAARQGPREINAPYALSFEPSQWAAAFMTSAKRQWQPSFIKRQEAALKTGTLVLKVQTDQGPAFVKAMGNPEGPHVLVCDLVGTRLANWFGLPTFEFATIEVIPAYGLTFFEDGEVEAGPAFITKEDPGDSWGGADRQLKELSNPDDITRLVVFDTWTLNCDRHAPGGRRINRNNVHLSNDAPEEKLLLRAMDHSHCFTCGRPLTPKISHIQQVQDEEIYGLFPEFEPWVDCRIVGQTIEKLQSFTLIEARALTQDIPKEWDLGDATTEALNQFLTSRAAFLASSIMNKLCPAFGPVSPTEEAESIP